MIRHLESCVRRAVAVRLARELYDFDHPSHCPHCEGWGGTIAVTDPALSVNAQVGENSAPVDNCQFCIAQGKCPRCGSPYLADSELAAYDPQCPTCQFELGVTEGKPYPHICVCATDEGPKVPWRMKKKRFKLS